MSRIAKLPLIIPNEVECKKVNNIIYVKGPKGTLDLIIVDSIDVIIDNSMVIVKQKKEDCIDPMLGTTRVLLGNMVHGVHIGFEKILRLIGVGYRAKLTGKILELNLGFSHLIRYHLPNSIIANTPNTTDIFLKSYDKQKLGQVAAEIRSYRPPEIYKGKGIRYDNERVILKETKKK